MREIFTYGSVGGASGDRCFYPEDGRATSAPFDTCVVCDVLAL